LIEGRQLRFIGVFLLWFFSPSEAPWPFKPPNVLPVASSNGTMAPCMLYKKRKRMYHTCSNATNTKANTLQFTLPMEYKNRFIYLNGRDRHKICFGLDLNSRNMETCERNTWLFSLLFIQNAES
jgi:hypothetical protein